MKKILIGTATYNEFKNIFRLINKILKKYPKVDLLVIDDNSPDKTKSLLYLSKKKFKKRFNFIIRKNKQGLNTAHKLIYNYALKYKYDFLITLDADFSHNPNDIGKIIRKLFKNDFVIGSRYMKGGENRMKKKRLLLSKWGNFLIGKLLKSNLSEHTTSFRGFNMINLSRKKFNLNEVKSNGYSFFMETIHILRKKNCKIKEIPIIFKDRKFGVSKIPKIEIFRTLYNLFFLKFQDILHINEK
jgi:dolichol-phosphate mannosyltransferase